MFLQNRHHRGFILTEAMAGLAIMAIVLALFGSQVVRLFASWRNMRTDVELFDAGRYMLTKMEREICLDAVQITVANNIIDMQTKQGDRQVLVRYSAERKGIYQDTTTNEGTGTNPLFIRDCLVENWQVQKIDDKKISVKFDLVKNNRIKNFARNFYCLNGVVNAE
ncbi:MAG: prepilin-type N-terminal cleavage/methylation domain-containing protein [Acidaminococcaceae bacterium]|nr:prepilin-type N-terminal cleavage/methylation domain-containing protein [Acidaminococcaceae bacterium]